MGGTVICPNKLMKLFNLFSGALPGGWLGSLQRKLFLGVVVVVGNLMVKLVAISLANCIKGGCNATI